MEGHLLQEGQTLQCDVCIVGAGVAGLTLARELIGSGLRVFLVESGGPRKEEEAQALAAGENVGIPFSSLDRMRVRALGGTSHRWIHSMGWQDRRRGARMRPLDAIDFEKRPGLDYSGWPYPKETLAPFYERAENRFGLPPTPYATEAWTRSGTPALLTDNQIRTVIFKIGPRNPFTETIPGLIADDRNITIVLHATVLRIETEETGQMVTHMQACTAGGKKFSIAARYFVLATGAIDVPRLLLLSNSRQPAGIGNRYDLVGRFFMEHLHFGMGRVCARNRRSMANRSLYHLHTRNQTRLFGQLAVEETVLRREGILNVCMGLYPGERVALKSHQGFRSLIELLEAIRQGHLPQNAGAQVRSILSEVHVLAASAAVTIRREAAHRFGSPTIFRLEHMSEQSPNPESRVTLSNELDRFGQRRARLDWRIQDIDLASVTRAHEILNTSLLRSGVGRVDMASPDEVRTVKVSGGYHHMGTTRMHDDPRQGVVDANCRVHGMVNLFVGSSSVFPTGGFANPTLTIGALVIKLADHLKILAAASRPVHLSEAAR